MNPNNRELRPQGASLPFLIKLVVLAAIVLRFLLLTRKAPHFDEGINGHFVMQIWDNGFFRYDPTNYHGPLYFYLLHLSEIILGRGIFAFRFMNAILATWVVVIAAKHARYIGRAAYWAAAVIALSPAFVFYGRYAIHETLLILCQMSFTYGFLMWHYERRTKAFWLMSFGVFGSFATKETFFIFFGTWFIALGLVYLFEKILPKKLRAKGGIPQFAGREKLTRQEWIVAAQATAVGVFVTLALYSGFFQHLLGIRDMIAAFAFWTKTGTGATGHEKPFIYWAQLLWIYEWPLLFALVASIPVALFGSFWMRVFTATGVGVWLAYSLIPYKTPWLIIGFWPLAFALGFLVTEIAIARMFAKGLALAAIVISLGFCIKLNFKEYQNPLEKYVYVQSKEDLNRVMRLINDRVAQHPEDRTMQIQIFMRDTWPLPWLMNVYTHAQFVRWSPSSQIDGAILLVDSVDSKLIEANLKETYLRIPFQIRDAHDAGYAYFQAARFSSQIIDNFERIGAQAGIKSGEAK